MSTSPDEVLQKFVDYRPRLKLAGDDVSQQIRERLAARALKAQISSRVKEVSSFRQKIALPKYRGKDLWSSVTDKVGVRVIVDEKNDVDHVHEAFRECKEVEIYNVVDKREEIELGELAYSGLHLDVYAPPREGDEERIPCEVQIRTVAQHAWSVVSHRLLYKPSVELPVAEQRAIMRLVALVEVFDEEVQRVVDVQVRSLARQGERASHRAALRDIVSAQFRRFTTDQSNRELSSLVLGAVAKALDDETLAGYAEILDQYVTSNVEALAMLYEDYGPTSELSASSDYVLWSQPESLAVLESLEVRPHRLYEAWLEEGLPPVWLHALAAHTDAAI